MTHSRTLICSLILPFAFVLTTGQYSSVPTEPVSEACLGCICEASSGCNTTFTCAGDICGLFHITWAYWSDAGKPVLPGDDVNAQNAYSNCATNPVCAAQAVINYMKKFPSDCNHDGQINCYDYATIHKLGGYGCSGGLGADNPYYKKFDQCARLIYNQSVVPPPPTQPTYPQPPVQNQFAEESQNFGQQVAQPSYRPQPPPYQPQPPPHRPQKPPQRPPHHPHPQPPQQQWPQQPNPQQPYPQQPPQQQYPQPPQQQYPQPPQQQYPQPPQQPGQQWPQKPPQQWPQQPQQPPQTYPQQPPQTYPQQPPQTYPQQPPQTYPQQPQQPPQTYPQQPQQPQPSYPQQPQQPYPQKPPQPGYPQQPPSYQPQKPPVGYPQPPQQPGASTYGNSLENLELATPAVLVQSPGSPDDLDSFVYPTQVMAYITKDDTSSYDTAEFARSHFSSL